jgi:hypothetical protein
MKIVGFPHISISFSLWSISAVICDKFGCKINGKLWLSFGSDCLQIVFYLKSLKNVRFLIEICQLNLNFEIQ